MATEIRIRSCIYHVAPLVTNEIWRRNIEQLAARWNVFNGCRAIAIAYGDTCHDFDYVANWISSQGIDNCQMLRVQNDRSFREVASFRTLLDRAYSTSPHEATFYAHSKGNSTYDDVRGATYWRNAMYNRLLDDADSCMEFLSQGFPAVGCCKMIWGRDRRSPYPSRLAHGLWMFAGTFFWFRNSRVFTHPRWKDVPRDRYGAEAWLSGLFGPTECKSIFQPWPESMYPVNPYDVQHYIRADAAIEDVELQHPSYAI